MYHSCSKIQRFHMNFAWRIDTGEKCIRLCTEPLPDTPGVALCETAEESILSFAKLRADMIAESKIISQSSKHEADENRVFTSECAKCSNSVLKDWDGGDGKVHYINLSMEPAPCQGRCIYCDVHNGDRGLFNKRNHAGYYERVFEAIKWAKKHGMIAADAKWQVSSNEITVHPYKDIIFELVSGQATTFFTNCFIYNESIAANLAANPRSSINFSIDSGTAETWLEIKGSDNFEAVVGNLKKYSASCVHPAQMTLKYIIFPGINDSMKDYLALAEIMMGLGVRHLTIACDLRPGSNKYSCGKEKREPLICAAGRLIAVLSGSEMTMNMSENGFLPNEAEEAKAQADEILRLGKDHKFG